MTIRDLLNKHELQHIKVSSFATRLTAARLSMILEDVGNTKISKLIPIFPS